MSNGRPPSPGSPAFIEALHGCSLHFFVAEKMRRKGRENIVYEDALEALRKGRIARDPSNRLRYVAKHGRLTVILLPLRTCNVSCITAFYRRA